MSHSYQQRMSALLAVLRTQKLQDKECLEVEGFRIMRSGSQLRIHDWITDSYQSIDNFFFEDALPIVEINLSANCTLPRRLADLADDV